MTPDKAERCLPSPFTSAIQKVASEDSLRPVRPSVRLRGFPAGLSAVTLLAVNDENKNAQWVLAAVLQELGGNPEQRRG